VALWWASPVECQSALFRQHREDALPRPLLNEALVRLEGLVEAHPLRAADALQLAAALVWCDEAPQGETFVCLDKRLSAAARREGFAVLPD